jgi:hypothetical protein
VAKNGNQELFNTLRASGVRRKIARTVSQSADRVTEEQSRVFRRTAHGLRAAADLLEVGASRNGASKNAKSKSATSARKKASKRPTTSATKSRSGSKARQRSTGPRVAKKAAASNRRTTARPRSSSSRAGSRSRA